MRVFVSWSGDGSLSHQVAQHLRDWLPYVIQHVEPYLSSEDTCKGQRWRDKVTSELEVSHYGILCLTPESISSEWMHFEAGALSNKIGYGFVSPFLVNVNPDHLANGPLGQFQATTYHDENDVRKLIRSINDVSEKPVERMKIDRTFDMWWPQLKEQIDRSINDSSSSESVSKVMDLEASIAELLILARGHQKRLEDLAGGEFGDIEGEGATKRISERNDL